MELSIIIVNWNSVQYLAPCLDSVVRHTDGIQCEIIVIDSGSFDGSAELVHERYPSVRFIQSPDNLGFAGANNLACRSAGAAHLLFLNPDTQVTAGAVQSMLDHLRSHPEAGAVGVRLLNSDGSLQSSCIQPFPTILNQLLSSDFLRAHWPRSALWGMKPLLAAEPGPASVDVISGACVMVRRAAFDDVGQFSEDYFMYAEDLDLCHKLRQAHYTNYCLPQASVVHHGGGSSDSAPSEFSVLMMRESIWRFLRKSRGAGYAALYRGSTLVAALARLLLLCLTYPLRRAPSRRGAMRKWAAVLAWSLKLRQAAAPAR
jgi:N-acetylglucosaminyl-diphospho-decaprenol L-rhamnosyltransferase